MSDGKVEKVMGEFKRGTLKDSHGNKVTDRDQALAIALSEAGISKSETMDKNSKEYKEKVNKLMKKWGIESPEELSDEKKKKFFSELDSMHTSDKEKGDGEDELQKAFEHFGLDLEDKPKDHDLFKSYSDTMNKGKATKTIPDSEGNNHTINLKLKENDQVQIGGVDCIFKGDHYEVTELGEGTLQRQPEKSKSLPLGAVRYFNGQKVYKASQNEWKGVESGTMQSK